MPKILWLAVIIAIVLMWVAVLAGCSDGCPEGQHRLRWTVNNVTNSMCVND